MANFRRFKMLSLKYLYFLKYHWIATLIEIVLPLILVYAVLAIIHTYPTNELMRNMTTSVTNSNKTFGFLIQYNPYRKIFYCPASSNSSLFEDEIMTQVKHLYIDEANSDSIVIERERNEKSLVKRIISAQNETDPIAGVVFLEPPDLVLNYKIRDMNEWNTSQIFCENETESSRPYEPDPYLTSGFVGLQQALNLAYFMRLKKYHKNDKYEEINKENQNFDSYYRAFPYPKYLESDPKRKYFPVIMGFVILLTSLILTGPIIVAIITERESGVKEWMKIAGLTERLLWLSWLLNSLILSLIVYPIITFFLIHGFYPEGAILEYVSPTLLFFMIMLFFMSQIVFCFMFCSIFHSHGSATASFIMSTIVLGIVAIKLHDFGSRFLVYCTCFFPPSALIQLFIRISYFELLGQYVGWENLFAGEMNTADATVGVVLLLLFVDIFLYFFLTYYISAINPGRFGFKKPWYFLFQRCMKDRSDVPAYITEDMIHKMLISEKHTEGPIKGAQSTLVLKDLQKRFGYTEAVRLVNLTAYSNEIIVLLGHEDAGKTTTLSMVTGLVKPSHGTLHYKRSLNIVSRLSEFRKVLGFCPQEDRLIPYMTALNILIFFGKLKEKVDEDVRVEAMAYLKLMDMSTKSGDLTSSLQPALKRKLCLCMALMGKSEVIVLDEPTAGVDAHSKEKIWSLLKELKHNRTILLTSNDMKEAAKIGDRIAILNHGMIVCNGSPNFLKRQFGSGYEVTIFRTREMQDFAKTLKDPSVHVIDAVIKTMRGSRLESRTPTKLVFFIPQASAPRFPALFKTLETKKDQLRVDHISIAYSDLDNVFQKIGGNSIYDEQGKLVKSFSEFDETRYTKKKRKNVTGPKLILQQHMALAWKKNLFTLRNVTAFILHIIIPTILMMILMRATVKDSPTEPALELKLSMYSSAKVIATTNVEDEKYKNNLFESDMKAYYTTSGLEYETHSNTSDIGSILLQYAEENIATFRRDIIYGHDFNFEDELALNSQKPRFFITAYNKFFRHSLPVAVDTIYNNIIQFWFKNDSFKITTVNHPIRSVTDSKSVVAIVTEIYQQESLIFIIWFLLLAFFTIALLDYFIIIIKTERIGGFKQLQYLSNISPVTYWLNAFIYDFLLFFIIVLIRVCFIKPFDSYGFFTLQHHASIVLLLIVLFMISGLLFIYSISFFQTTVNGSYIFFIIFNLICLFVTSTFLKYESYLLFGKGVSMTEKIILYPTRYIILVMPPFNFSLAFQKLILIWRNNVLANYKIDDEVVNKAPRYIDLSKYEEQPYLAFASKENPHGILLEVIFLLGSIFLYTFLLMLMEKRIFQMIGSAIFERKKSKSRWQPPPSENEENKAANVEPASENNDIPPDVAEEKALVEELVKGGEEPQAGKDNKAEQEKQEWDGVHMVVVYNLTKLGRRSILKTVAVIDDVNFAVETGQGFGLLSRDDENSKVLQMVCGTVRPTSGELYIQNIKLRSHRKKYLSHIGYCSDKNSFLDNLTGREHLELMAMMKGVDRRDLDQSVEYWMNTLDLGDVQNKPVGTYSGGNQRKLSSAIALLGDPIVIVLDQPTAGVDPVSRRKLYTVLEKLKITGETILLASHSMAECEALCEKVTVMIDGEMKFVGSVNELRSEFASGFSATILIRHKKPGEKPAARTAIIDKLKQVILGKFSGAELKDETEEFLHYIIRQAMTWAEGFQKMEELKKTQKIILEYQLSEISLQEAYDSFYKKPE